MYKAPLLYFLSPWNLYLENSPCANCVFFFFFSWQDIVQDERSDKEETESDDEGEDLREKSKNGHMQNGHTPFNNNHKKRNWLDFDQRRDDGRYGAPSDLTWRAEGQQAAHANIHIHM